ncbi:hypothetical protein BS50DRAFT_498847 [Corynespora cassiicola Philippines]|uniref:Uncharacterized protein n=1 Tax=Corynespora cassiicola Philippines TaxID=1448308 RepID=A0A2T2NG49_CORCC|nr:hypothetical protein BS50DRAFT_498847 [Corynespora cassiicola Philippines]
MLKFVKIPLERQISIVRVSGIVQNALGKKMGGEIERQDDSCGKEHPVIAALGYIAGKILQVGPDYRALVGSSFAEQKWTGGWLDNYREPEDLEILRQLNEDYTARIIDFEDTDLARIRTIYNPYVSARSIFHKGHHGSRALNFSHTTEYQKLKEDLLATDKSPRICLGTKHLLGLVPPTATVGDVIVRFWNCNAAIVMRPVNTDPMRPSYILVGRADVAEMAGSTDSSASTTPSSTSRWISSPPPGSHLFTQHSEAVYVDLDLKSLQMITSNILV